MVFLSFLSVVGFIFFVSHYLTFRTVASFFAISSIILLLFFFGTLDILGIGAKILMILGWVLLVFSCFKIVKATIYQSETLWHVLSTRISIGTWFFIGLGIIWFILTRHFTVFGWDEFFWAEFVKAIKFHDGFYRPFDAIQQDLRYPPASQLFQYFFITFTNYKESALYFAHGLIPLAATAVVVDFSREWTTATNKEPNAFMVVCAVFVCIACFFGAHYPTIINDPILGVFFGTGLIFVIFYKPFSKLLLPLVPILAVLPLIKETGIILAIIIAITYIARLLMETNWVTITDKGNLIKTILLIVIPFVIPFFTRQIWIAYLGSIHLSLPYNVFTFKAIINVIFHPVGKTKIIAHHFYFKSLWILLWVCLFSMIFISCIYKLYAKKEFLKKLCIYVIALGGWVGYVLFQLVAYDLIFSEYEGINLASFKRYMSSYLLALGLLAILSLFLYLKQFSGKKRKTFIYSMLAVFSIWFLAAGEIKFVTLILSPTSNKSASVVIHRQLLPVINLVNKHVPSGRHVFVLFVYQNSDGMAMTVFRYAITPRNSTGWSYGDKYSNKDQWTFTYTQEQFVELLRKNDYVAIGYADDNFWRHYGSLFGPHLDVVKHYLLFKVKTDPTSTQVSLIPIE